MGKNSPDVAKPAITRLRCAIYTRKSTEEGLDQEFNSLDAQREAGEAFIQSQRREGWITLPECYDDQLRERLGELPRERRGGGGGFLMKGRGGKGGPRLHEVYNAHRRGGWEAPRGGGEIWVHCG